MPLTGKRIPLLVILGPTAVGKTELAIRAALAFDGEIVNADSRQIYRSMDIGTAKPTAAQRAQVPHHLIDLVDPDENLTAAEFQQLATDAITGISTRGKLPILAGGTGQYLTAVVEGWTIPKVPPNPELRASLEQYAATHGAEALHERLRQADPAAAAAIHVNNIRRVIRALEVIEMTGQPFSQQRRKTPPPYETLQLGLTMERDALYERADQRIDTMMQMGFLEEVRELLKRGYARDLPSMSGLGYAQLATALCGEITLDEAVRQTKTATHDFIRRQYTWFRGHDSGIIWYDCSVTPLSEALKRVGEWLAAEGDQNEA